MKHLLSFILLFAALSLAAQEDLTYTGTKITSESEVDSSGKLFLGGYIDTYYALYSDTSSPGSFVKFPTVSPRNNNPGLNILQLQAKYHTDRFRGVATFFWGDVPHSAWSPVYNMIQEAHVGIKIRKGLWMDVGLFRTHLGLESIQPRENIAHSIAVTTYFEPYYLSGAKLTYEVTDKLRFQACVLNGFNTFVDNNRNKAVGLSGVYDFSKRSSLTVNTLICDEADQPFSKKRIYNNAYFIHKREKLDLGAEFNVGSQRHSRLDNINATAFIYSGLLAVKYRCAKKFAVYGRGEFFEDSDEVLTGPVENEHHQLVGINLVGYTLGLEFTPIKNSYIRFEGRQLHTTEDEKIFVLNDKPSSDRFEGIAAFGVWF